MSKIKVHLMLGRPFALPAAVCSIVLGGIIVGAGALHIFIAVMAGILLMCACHSWNSFHDYVITKFDVGTVEERSKEKAYTGGQSVIAQGLVSTREVLLNSLGWLGLSIIPAAFLSAMVTPWVWLPWGLMVICAPWYSEAKLRYHPEIPLGLGFGPFAVWMGMCAVGMPDFGEGFLAGLPFFIIFGFVAETADQWYDWEPNYPKGLRNIGALIGYHKLCIGHFVGYMSLGGCAVQIALVLAGILVPMSLFSLLAFPLVIYCMLYIEWNPKAGVLFGLAAVLVYEIAFVVGQAIGT